ncbi:hypothetical protein TNCV_5120791 [Trichonephila clavipes]|nr:hypothetical protein TNCV_5120791 [Trichonephila clavipes]
MDKYDVSKCCYMSIVIDSFKNRPAATQCYNCNYFNLSSANCEMKPRCLKCSRDHRTGDFPIKERIENPNALTAKRKATWQTGALGRPFLKLNLKNEPPQKIAKARINLNLNLSIQKRLSQD